jgi:hypothetical protein
MSPHQVSKCQGSDELARVRLEVTDDNHVNPAAMRAHLAGVRPATMIPDRRSPSRRERAGGDDDARDRPGIACRTTSSTRPCRRPSSTASWTASPVRASTPCSRTHTRSTTTLAGWSSCASATSRSTSTPTRSRSHPYGRCPMAGVRRPAGSRTAVRNPADSRTSSRVISQPWLRPGACSLHAA